MIGKGKVAGFKELNVWQLGKELAVSIYKITADGAFKSDFGLRDQIRRARRQYFEQHC
ncbi:MAG: four helix bundle protein [Smithellaceae bacterium]